MPNRALVLFLALLLLYPGAALAQGDETAYPQARPSIFIRSSSTEPRSVAPGGQVMLSLELHNVGDVTALEIMVTCTGQGFVPVGSSTVKNVPSLQPDEHGWVGQAIQVSKEVSGDLLPITVSLSYTDGQGFAYTSSEVVGVRLLVPTATPLPVVGVPQLVIESFSTEPPLPLPGEPFSLTLCLRNTGTGAARNVLLTNGTPSSYAPLGAGNVTAVGHIARAATALVSLRLVADQDAEPGLHTHPLSLDYDNTAGDHVQSAQNIAIELGKSPIAATPAPQPLVVLDTYAVEPETLSPGQPFTLTLAVRNVGSGSARQVTLTLGGRSSADKLSPIAPLGSGNVKYLDLLAPGAAGQVTTSFIVDGSAAGGVYLMSVDLDYLDEKNAALERSEQISVVVKAQPQLEASFYGLDVRPLVGQPFDLAVEVVNVGRTRANTNNAELLSQDLELEAKPLYVGPIDSGTSVVLEGQQAVARSPGPNRLIVRLHYIDDFNQKQTLDLELLLQVEEQAELGPALEPGAPVKEGPGSTTGQWQQKAAERPFLIRLLRGLLGLGSG